jgi:hypothetical protein
MHVIRFKKFITPKIGIGMGFSKLKLNPPMPKPVMPGLKPIPSFKAPNLDKNIKTNMKLDEQPPLAKHGAEAINKV